MQHFGLSVLLVRDYRAERFERLDDMLFGAFSRINIHLESDQQVAFECVCVSVCEGENAGNGIITTVALSGAFCCRV
jgi:hypothetical protein